jgi:predicted alpha/beta-hydrolase family hydrolase
MARLHLCVPVGGVRRSHGTLMLGHGAGGGVEADDLRSVTAAVVELGWRVVLLEQPWRVAGRRAAAPPPRLDQAWVAAAAPLGAAAGPLVVGGRSAGARVACRTALTLGAVGVVALAFPLHPPGRPERSRAFELAGAGVPVLVVQGRRDPFGTPSEVSDAVPGVEVVAVDGDHSLARSAAEVAHEVAGWLRRR